MYMYFSLMLQLLFLMQRVWRSFPMPSLVQILFFVLSNLFIIELMNVAIEVRTELMEAACIRFVLNSKGFCKFPV
jgi:hypothetical protein